MDSAVVAAEAESDETGAATAEPAESAGPETAVAEGVEIPKQQSAEAAADDEAGKSTRK
ncbi:gliding motility protein [Streptomyces scopuliridis]|uniref:gliding motility protein n=1 Tax=Streptomyces scopuliridis TaxID=452529 RepID=UPI00367D4905